MGTARAGTRRTVPQTFAPAASSVNGKFHLAELILLNRTPAGTNGAPPRTARTRYCAALDSAAVRG